jgi:hypothetical protein
LAVNDDMVEKVLVYAALLVSYPPILKIINKNKGELKSA